jgi:hypothetical protein
VFATAERMTDADTLEMLSRSGVALFVVDEAHCDLAMAGTISGPPTSSLRLRSTRLASRLCWR